MYEIWYGLLKVYAVPVGVFVRDGIFDALKSVVRGERQGVGDTPIIQHSTRDGRGEKVARAVEHSGAALPEIAEVFAAYAVIGDDAELILLEAYAGYRADGRAELGKAAQELSLIHI